ncbi:MAG: MFS transporter [Candidatus Altiarchaeota archaeon]|nr:MFS transporter [Candidatus Altiarchaeota archaeon]
MNELIMMMPYKVILAAYSSLPALILLSMGKGAIEIGILNSISLFGLLFGPILWSRFARVTNRKYLVAMGYLWIIVGLFMLTHTALIYPAVFVLAFFPQAVYFVAMAEIRRKEGSLGEALGNLEQTVGLAWAVGLLLGFVGVNILSLDQFTIVLASLATLSIPIVTRVIGEANIAKTVQDGIEELKEFEVWLFSTIGKIKIRAPQIKLEPRAFSLYLFGIVFSLSSGIIFPQLTTLLKFEFNAVKLIYMCLLIDALSSSAFFRIAGSLRHRGYIFGYILRLCAYSILLLSIMWGNMLLFLSFYLINGISWGFIMMFFEYSGLKIGEEVFGTFLFFRVLSFAIASAFSGILINSLGFFDSFLIAAILFSTTIFLYTEFESKSKKDADSHTQVN